MVLFIVPIYEYVISNTKPNQTQRLNSVLKFHNSTDISIQLISKIE